MEANVFGTLKNEGRVWRREQDLEKCIAIVLIQVANAYSF